MTRAQAPPGKVIATGRPPAGYTVTEAKRTTDGAAGLPISRSELTRLRMTIGRFGRVLRQQTDLVRPYTLTSLIFSIARLQPVTVGQLAAAERVTPPSVTRSLNRLTELGLISRELGNRDRRVTFIRLTSRGIKERDEILREREIWLTSQLGRLTAAEVKSLLEALPALERLCDIAPGEHAAMATLRQDSSSSDDAIPPPRSSPLPVPPPS